MQDTRKRMEKKERVSKKFLLSLLEPYLPTLKTNQKIIDLSIRTFLDDYEFTYVIIEERGGVNNS